jgi:hypothetical protein
MEVLHVTRTAEREVDCPRKKLLDLGGRQFRPLTNWLPQRSWQTTRRRQACVTELAARASWSAVGSVARASLKHASSGDCRRPREQAAGKDTAEKKSVTRPTTSSCFRRRMTCFDKREVAMRKMVLGTAGALILLLAPLLTWNSQAVAYSGTLFLGPTHSPVQNVDCEAADDLCEKNKHLVCARGDDGKLECECEDCGGHGVCPRDASICCPPGTCCVCIGRFKCCPI